MYLTSCSSFKRVSVWESVLRIRQILVDRFGFVRTRPEYEVVLLSAMRLGNIRWHCWFEDRSIGQDAGRPGDNEASRPPSIVCLPITLKAVCSFKFFFSPSQASVPFQWKLFLFNHEIRCTGECPLPTFQYPTSDFTSASFHKVYLCPCNFSSKIHLVLFTPFPWCNDLEHFVYDHYRAPSLLFWYFRPTYFPALSRSNLQPITTEHRL